MSLDKYKPGQIITSMSRRTFLDLWDDIKSGAAQRRWAEKDNPQTKKERLEAIRINTIVIIFEDHSDAFDVLLSSDDWKSIEVYKDKKGVVCFRTRRDRTRESEEEKAFLHAIRRMS